MLDDGAFSRRMPRCIDLADRVRIEAIVTACDVVNYSYHGLVRCLQRIADRPHLDITEPDRIETALFCWSIVDQFYALSKLLEPFRDELNEWAGYEKYREIISTMRNYMDHLGERIGNYSKKIGPYHPLHGAILFSRGFNECGDVEYVIFGLGGIHHGSQVSPIIDRSIQVLEDEVSYISFSSFDKDLIISSLYEELCQFIAKFDVYIEGAVTETIRKGAIAGGFDPNVLLQDRVVGTMKAIIRCSAFNSELNGYAESGDLLE